MRSQGDPGRHGGKSLRRFAAGLALCVFGAGLGAPNEIWHAPGAAALYHLGVAWLIAASASPWRAALAVFAASAAAWVFPIYWVSMPGRIQGGAAAQIAWLWPSILAVGQGVYLGMLAFAARLCAGRAGVLATGLYFGAGFALVELAKAEWCKGPMLHSVAGLAPWPWTVQACSLAGADGLAGLIAACAWWLASGTRRGRLACACLLALLCLHSALSLASAPGQTGTLRMALVQANLPKVFAMTPGLIRERMERYFELTAKALKENKPELIVWPETALPGYFDPDRLASRYVREMVRGEGVPLLLGAFVTGEKDGRQVIRNRALLLGPDGLDLGHADKRRLVPFGEYIPRYFGFIPKMVSSDEQIEPGVSFDPLALGRARLGSLICFETLFASAAQQSVERGANLLVNISNDILFQGSSEQEHHLAYSTLRAVEQGRFMVVCANTGISAVIDPRGRVLVRSERDREAIIDAGPVGLAEESTVYARIYTGLYATLIVGFVSVTLWVFMGALRERNRRVGP